MTAESCRSATGDADEAAQRATVDENSKIALSMQVVKWFSGPSIIARVEVRVRAVKVGSRAQRGRSNAERLDGADANLTIERTARQDFGNFVTVLPCIRWHIDADNCVDTRAVDIEMAEIASISHPHR